MSEVVYYKGVLKEVELLEGENLEEQCKRLLEGKELPTYFDSYEEFLLEENYEAMVVHEGVLYRVEKEELDPESSVFNARRNEQGEIEFEVRYYNGGYSFDEAISRSIKRMDK